MRTHILNKFQTTYFFGIFSLLLIILLIPYQANSRGYGYILQEDTIRCEKFNKDRTPTPLMVHTQNISSVLTDDKCIDYSKKATIIEKEIAFKAIMGGVLIHKDAYKEEMFKRAAIFRDIRYERHYENVKAVYLASKTLWKMFEEKADITFEALLLRSGLTSCRGMLTEYFIEWFYETLSDHHDELSYFAPAAYFGWYKKAQEQYERGTIETDFSLNKFHLIRDVDGKPLAIYKQKINQSGDPTRNRPRQTECELMSWIFAKNVGLDSVVNPVIPVRLNGRHLSLDYFHPTGTLEPLTSVVYRGESTDFSYYDEKTRPFLKRYLEFIRKRDEYYKKAMVFSRRDWTILRFNKVSLKDFLKGRTLLGEPSWEAKTQLVDIQTFKKHDVLDPNELLKVALFVFLTRLYDPHESNVVFVPQTNGNFKSVVYDYDLTWNPELWTFPKNEVYVHRLNIHEFAQAKTHVNQGIVTAVLSKLTKFRSVFDLLRRKITHSEFTSLTARAESLRTIASTRGLDLRNFMKTCYKEIKINALEAGNSRDLRIDRIIPLGAYAEINKFMTITGSVFDLISKTTVYNVTLPSVFCVESQEQLDLGFEKGYS